MEHGCSTADTRGDKNVPAPTVFPGPLVAPAVTATEGRNISDLVPRRWVELRCRDLE